MNRRHRYAFATAAAIWTCCAAQPAIAQLPDLVELSAQYMPGVPVEDPRPARAQVASYDASFNVPIALGQRTFLIPGLVYHAEAISFSQVPAEFIELREFHSLETSFLFVQLLPEGWSISLRLAPGVAGDFAAFDSGMLRLSTVAMATKAFSERFVLGGGAIASYAFGTLLPLPMVYLDWTPTRYFRLETSIPAFLNAKVTVWDRVEIGARAEVAGNAYAVRDSRIRSAWPCAAGIDDQVANEPVEIPAEPAECFDHMAYSVASAGAVVGVRLFSSVWLNAFVGHSFYRRFEQMNEFDERITGGVQDLPNTLLIRAGLTFRIPRE